MASSRSDSDSRAASQSRAKESRSPGDVDAGKTERLGSKPASLSGGITRTGTVPTRSHQVTIAASRRPNSRRSRSDVAIPTIGRSIGPRWAIGGGAISRYLLAASETTRDSGEPRPSCITIFSTYGSRPTATSPS